MSKTPVISAHYEQADATNRTVTGNYISITNNDSTNSMSFTLTGASSGAALTNAITVLAGETYSNWFDRFSAVVVTNANNCAIVIDIGA